MRKRFVTFAEELLSEKYLLQMLNKLVILLRKEIYYFLKEFQSYNSNKKLSKLFLMSNLISYFCGRCSRIFAAKLFHHEISIGEFTGCSS